jgi:5'-nucleotidase/UDP-sugar diphosphatase
MSMKSLKLIAVPLLLVIAAVGCSNKNKVQKNASVTDIGITAPREPSLAYAGPISAAPQPDAFYEPAITQTPSAAGTASGSYTVRKGDTLFSIAKQSYGNGNQWQRIASANPGLAPSTLKAGQKIMIP